MAEQDARGGSATAQLLRAMRAVVGAANVADDGATLARYARSTAARGTMPLAVVRPGSRAEVVALVDLARRYRAPLYPVSTGKNWGYGDACAVTDGQVVLELARMNRIVQVDPQLAYAVIEPGVTQQQLADYLRERGIGLQIDCTGAGPDTSFLGNILERGFGHSPYGNRLAHIAGMQVVLASGEVLDTGFGHYPNARTAHLFPYGVGPFLDGLFTQSNFGVVTQVGIWLMPKAECINHFLCTVPAHEDIAEVIDALRPLRLDGTLRSIVHIGNDLRVLSGGCTFPREQAGDQSMLPADMRSAMRARAGAGAWTVSGALYGSALQVAAARAALKKALRGTQATTIFLTERTLKQGAFLANLLGKFGGGQRLRARVALGNALFAMNRGVPNGRFLAGAYWRRRGGLPSGFPMRADPGADNCGMLWVSPVLPMRGVDVLALHALAAPIFAHYRFDLFATFSMINERALGGVLTVAYDKDDPAEVDRAQMCHAALFDAAMKAGYIPYRVGIGSMAALDPHGDVYWKTVSRIKRALDPDGIIAPGRYEPGLQRRIAKHDRFGAIR
ncbi:FAD-binding oxidoreductase [Massilia sp. R2A-15]|uniref:FAD-binding oxidoreductase n=1 Tax=Massilia sp. R2A-15 TaxID=3064278 RepID=UPI002732E15A|nr:FAD-binding oxidoreductase [Massilia sp. R2A-15]WLI91296.1 FAD-binding oxidoreductase [Massilia sp. R2A-15]